MFGLIPFEKVIKKADKYKIAGERAKYIVKQIIKNRKVGKQAEELLKSNSRLTDEFGTLYSKVSETVDKPYKVSYKAQYGDVKGKIRYFDLVSSKGTAIESKVGNPKLNDFTKLQIKKDIDALQTKTVKKIVWLSNANNKGSVRFDEDFIKYAKDLLKSKGLDENLLDFRGKNFTPPYLNTSDIYNGIN